MVKYYTAKAGEITMYFTFQSSQSNPTFIINKRTAFPAGGCSDFS